MKTEKEKMLAGAFTIRSILNSAGSATVAVTCACGSTPPARTRSRSGSTSLPSFWARRPTSGFSPPFFCDYGTNIVLGTKIFFNLNCVVLDVAPVRVGSNVLFGPSVQIYTATHPIHAAERRQWLESAKPITIGSDAWVGGGAILCPGVSVGDRSVCAMPPEGSEGV